MSIEAITWALNGAPIPTGRNASTLAFVLVGLANHADPDGHNAFPAVATLVRYTRLSERSVHYALRDLENLGLITPSDPDIIAAYIKRADRRPKGWDLPIHNTIHSTIHNVVHSDGGGVHTVHPAASHGVQTRPHGVQTTTSRGARRAPEPSLNRPLPGPGAHDDTSSSIPPVCGQCDARNTDPISARIVWLDTDHTRSQRCPRCHPHADHVTGQAGGLR
jgi:Helix-turn-helix domain